MLWDVRPDVVARELDGLQRQARFTWTEFCEKFPVKVNFGSSAHEVPVRHYVAGKNHPWDGDLSDDPQASATPAGDEGSSTAVALFDTRGRATRSGSGSAAPGKGSSDGSFLDELMEQIRSGARFGNMALVEGSLQKLRESLTVPAAQQGRISTKTGKAVGGTAYRPDFLLRCVLAAEHVKLDLSWAGFVLGQRWCKRLRSPHSLPSLIPLTNSPHSFPHSLPSREA